MQLPHINCIDASTTSVDVRNDLVARLNELQQNLVNIFNDIAIWSAYINAPHDSHLNSHVTALKQTLITLVDHVANIPNAVDALQAPAIQRYVDHARKDVTRIQQALLSLNTVNGGSDEQYQDLLLETVIRVYRIVSASLRNTVAEPCSTVFIISKLSTKLQHLQETLYSTLSAAPPAVPAPRQPLCAVDPLPRLSDGSIDPTVLLTCQSPKIDYNQLYRLTDWSDIYDDTPAARAALADANSTMQAALLLRHDHPLVIYAQNTFAHQLHRYHNRLNICFNQLYASLNTAQPAAMDDETSTAIHEHLDSVQTALVTIVQYVSRLTPTIANTPVCAATCDTGLRSIVMLVRQLVIYSDEYVKKHANDAVDASTAAGLLFDVLVTVTRLVALPLQQVNALMDFIELRQSESALNAHITETLRALVASFGSLDINRRYSVNASWDADAVHVYIQSLDKILHRFRKMRSSTDATLQQLHAIRENVSKVLTTVQYIHGNVAERRDANTSIGGGMNVGQLHGHLGRSVQQLRDVNEQLNNAVDASVLNGLGDTAAGENASGGDAAFAYVVNHSQQFVKATKLFHSKKAVETDTTSDTVTKV